MAVELKVPEIGESITEVEIGEWFKKEGDEVQAGEAVVELESDKATIELPAPVAGTVVTILKLSGQTAQVGEVIGRMEEGAGAAKAAEAPAERAAPAPEAETVAESPRTAEQVEDGEDAAAEGTSPAAPAREESAPAKADRTVTRVVMPGAQRLLAEHGLSAEEITASGPGGRLLKEDVLRHLASEPGEKESADESMPAGLGEAARQGAVKAAPDKARAAAAMPGESARQERKVRMSPMRRAIAQRLVTAQQSGALLTTFNEVNMQPVMAMRDDLREEFQERYGVKLGFMSFFVKACVEALRRFEMINAEIRGDDVVYKDYCDIGIAVSSAKGLVVPVLRNAERLTFGEIEMQIGDFAARGKENKIRLDELEGGTFTISNGGVFGSLLSTPIVNPPQSAVLGMHVVQDRPVAENGQVVIRPMMYVALTYDHRIVDGREAVSFLKTIKELLERPTRLVFKSLM